VTSSIKLYGYATSPYVRKTGAFLYYKKLPFTHVPVNPFATEDTLEKFGGTQVPVLEIGDEWRRESSDHALWLDEKFPERPLCPSEHREKILQIDEWVSTKFFMLSFRGALDEDDSLQRRFRFWRLAAIVSAHTPMPEEIRNQWPEMVQSAPFIHAMKQHMNMQESTQDMQMRVMGELMGHIGEGPYIGGFSEPTMLDLAIVPQLLFGFFTGIEEKLEAFQIPALKEWIIRVTDHLPENPVLAHDMVVIRTLKDAL
jgi:glutathione S-transferase